MGSFDSWSVLCHYPANSDTQMKIKDFAQLLMLFLIGLGLIIGIVQLTLWVNTWFAYPLGLGLSILVVLGFFEIIEKAR
jgi:hypothetical protein